MSPDTLAICGTIVVCTWALAVVIEGIAKKAAGQRAALYEQLYRIASKQDGHLSVLSGIAHSVSPKREQDNAWLDDLMDRVKPEKPQGS